MLYEFLTTHRTLLIKRCTAKAASRSAPPAPALAGTRAHGVPLFLDQLIRTLRLEQAQKLAGGSADRDRRIGIHLQTADDDIGTGATRNGRDLMQQGFTVSQVVHDYGDLCQAVTNLAVETGAAITVGEFRTLNRCLDDAIASAVAEFSVRHHSRVADDQLRISDARARNLLQELEDHVQAASLSVAALKSGNVGLNGATGAMLDLALIAMRTLIERSLAVTTDTVELHVQR